MGHTHGKLINDDAYIMLEKIYANRRSCTHGRCKYGECKFYLREFDGVSPCIFVALDNMMEEVQSNAKICMQQMQD
jgi:hypothetical protein